jgi:nicotinate-nucleotide pyrophosphorylase (carboxylating)
MNIKIKEFVKNALIEDIGRGDLFAKVFKPKTIKAVIISKEDSILSGKIYAQALSNLMDIDCEFLKNDGDKLSTNEIFITLKGDSNSILSLERTFLNLLQHSSGIATNTNKYVKLLKSTNIKLLDTRKTRANLRDFEKYSVVNGGGHNHRMGLDDCLMLKDTHLNTISNLEDFILKARQKIPFTAKIECECHNIKKAKEALNAKVDIIMCDNMKIDDIKKVILLKNEISKNTLIEVSGNINKENISNYTNLEIDAISSGSLIHQAQWVDFSMKVVS